MLQLQREPSQVENVHGEGMIRQDKHALITVHYNTINSIAYKRLQVQSKRHKRSQTLVNRQMDKFHSVQ